MIFSNDRLKQMDPTESTIHGAITGG